MSQEVEIFIEKDGRVRVEVRGVKGSACLDLTRDMEEALGGRIELREMTSEAGETAQTEGQQDYLNTRG